GRLERGDYSIEKVLLETMPGYYLGGNLFRPLGRRGKFPGVLKAHGHWPDGRLEHTIPKSPGETLMASNPGFGISMARQGFVVFAWDMVGWNDTKQTIHEFGGPREMLWAFGPLGLQLWNATRAMDFLQSLPDVDPDRIAMTGASGGGSQTFLLSAVDERVKVSAPVNMVSAIMQGGSPCENAPSLRVDSYNVEFAAMMAPRPMLIVSSPWDQSRNTPNEEYVVTQGIYLLNAALRNVGNVHVRAQHNYNRESREAVYRFFAKHLLGDSDEAKFAEKPYTLEKRSDMLALHGRNLPENAKNYDGIFNQWREMALRQTGQTRDLDVLRRRLSYALGAEVPANTVQENTGEKAAIGRPGRRDRVAGLWYPGEGSPLLVVHPSGAAEARKIPVARAAIAGKRPVLLIDAFQTGSSVANRDRTHRYFLTFNRSDDANRVQDILTALAFLKSRGPEKIELHGIGTAAIWCTFAAAVAGFDLTLNADLNGFSGTDEEFLNRFFVPGVQRAGGLDAALRLTADARK
ncbi:MAG: acetylxylan esterase, partial [Bryobacteraceae bacterium]